MFCLELVYSDVCSGYYAFRKDLITKINLTSDGFQIEQELFAKVGKMKAKAVEIPHSYRKRMHGTSKTQDFRQGMRDLLYLISLFFHTD